MNWVNWNFKADFCYHFSRTILQWLIRITLQAYAYIDNLCAQIHPPLGCNSPQKTPQATPEWPWRLCWSSMATADIALHSLFILSARPARFTYSPLRSLAANRLWTSRLSIMEGSLTVFWQARWIDSSSPLFIFACLASSLLSWVHSLACLVSRSNQPPHCPLLLNPPNLFLSLHQTSDTDKITGCVFHSLVFYVSFFSSSFYFFSAKLHGNTFWMAAGKKECSTSCCPLFKQCFP